MGNQGSRYAREANSRKGSARALQRSHFYHLHPFSEMHTGWDRLLILELNDSIAADLAFVERSSVSSTFFSAKHVVSVALLFVLRFVLIRFLGCLAVVNFVP